MDNETPTFCLATNSLDRDKDRLDVSSLDLDFFLANPIMLAGHNRDKPIGTWENIRIEDGKLLAEPNFANTPLGQEYKQLVADRVIRTASVGFSPAPDSSPENEAGGRDFSNAELLEVSLVTVPANREALRVKDAPVTTMRKDFSLMAIKTKSNEPELEKQESEEKEAALEDVLAALQALADRVSALEAAANEDVEAEDDSDSEEKEEGEDKELDEEEKAFALLASILK